MNKLLKQELKQKGILVLIVEAAVLIGLLAASWVSLFVLANWS